jgi:hypothetical protein
MRRAVRCGKHESTHARAKSVWPLRRLGVARVTERDVRYGHRSACGVASMPFAHSGEPALSPSGLRWSPTPAP